MVARVQLRQLLNVSIEVRQRAERAPAHPFLRFLRRAHLPHSQFHYLLTGKPFFSHVTLFSPTFFFARSWVSGLVRFEARRGAIFDELATRAPQLAPEHRDRRDRRLARRERAGSRKVSGCYTAIE
jgi:hypothetical protein